MLILNLFNPKQSDVKYHINNFPDGQKSITLLEPEELYKGDNVLIVTQLTIFADFELVLSAVSALQSHTYKYSLYAPYIMGLRGDRKFTAGGDFYFTDVIQPLLDTCKFDGIFTFDPHSDTGMMFESLALFDYIKPSYYTVIFPDKTAAKRFEDACGTNFVTSCTFQKVRTFDGVVQEAQSDKKLRGCLAWDSILIYDDLCDGGASFVGLVHTLRTVHEYKEKITLFVTHMIASNIDNIKALLEMDVEIVTSNSTNHTNLTKLPRDRSLTVFDVWNVDFIRGLF